jgi:putative redox protein
MPKIEVVRTQVPMGFTATDERGLSIKMDSPPQDGTAGYGVSPMQDVLMALGGCSGIDIVSILEKQRQPLGSLKLIVEGEREKDKVPALWEKVHVRFLIGGAVSREKAEYAAKLSVDKYCSVAETLRRAGCAITWEVELVDD